MTAADGFQPSDAAPLRRCAANVAAALALVTRPAKLHPRRPWIEPRQLAIAAGIIVVVIVLCMILLDAPIARAVTRLPRWAIWPFDQITDFGKSGWFLWPLGVLLLLLAALPPALTRFSERVLAAIMVRVGFLFTAIAVPSLFDTIIKRMIGRARPLVGGQIDPFVFAPFIWRADHASLPSGHVTTAFAVLAAFGCLWPRARTALLLYALLIAASRIVVTAHFASDVIAGAVVGTVGALLVRHYFALRRLGFSIAPDGTLHQFPGPSLKRIKAVARELLAP
jgi:undecaprenyl-diphosphatase